MRDCKHCSGRLLCHNDINISCEDLQVICDAVYSDTFEQIYNTAYNTALIALFCEIKKNVPMTNDNARLIALQVRALRRKT